MEREHLYRGKRLHGPELRYNEITEVLDQVSGEWIEGDLIKDGDKAYIGSFIRMVWPIPQVSYTDFYETIPKLEMRGVPVIPETVGQFTGLLDKNGTKIFEGDIISNFGLKSNHVCEFINGAFGYYIDADDFVSFSENGCNFKCIDGQSSNIEATGNIHDTPK